LIHQRNPLFEPTRQIADCAAPFHDRPPQNCIFIQYIADPAHRQRGSASLIPTRKLTPIVILTAINAYNQGTFPQDLPPIMNNNATLSLKRVAIDTYHENVAYLHRDCPLYKAEGFQALSKIEIQQDGRKILAVLNVVDDDCIVSLHELGLSEQAFQHLDLPEQTQVLVNHAEPPHSMEYVRQKLGGTRLDQTKLTEIITDIAGNRYSKTEIAAFIVAVSEAGLDRDEILYLTRAMVDSGQRLDWKENIVVDKHCIGGIPGNRTSMLVVPIVAAFGLLCPKTSSRAITSPAGT